MKLMNITIDGRPITVDPSDKNIVDVVDNTWSKTNYDR